MLSRKFALFLPFIFIFSLSSCELEEIISQTTNSTAIDNREAAMGLKDALTKGVAEASEILSQVDGFYKNPEVHIPLPPDVQKVASTLRDMGLGSLVDKVELTINRAAEDAAAKAKPIFIQAIREMSFEDAMKILFGPDTAATHYLRAKTYEQLYAEFKPVISQSLEKVEATKYWSEMITTYNKIPLVKDVNPDLVDYVNKKALDGVFKMVADEEKAIRENPVERTTAIMKKVFDYYDKNKGKQ